ncbi:MAG: hypothetical protein HHAS10_05660 [Candidatus Altimarinota bacterium]
MKKSVALLVLLFPLFSHAQSGEEEGFILYKRPLLPGFSLNQTDDTTELIYRGKTIKTYKNAEFAIELLPHGPNEEPDCYNSSIITSSSLSKKARIGADYFRDCFILKSDKILNQFLLFYSPSFEGNRVSIYDIRKKKFYHWILNTVLSYRRDPNGAIIFLTKSTQNLCNRSIVLFENGTLKKLTDSCLMSSNGIPVKIYGFKILGNDIEVTFSELNLIEGEYVVSKTQKQYILTPPDSQTEDKTIIQTGSTLLLHSLSFH